MITDYFARTLHGTDVNDVWFQQDGAWAVWQPQTTIDLLCQTFDGQLIRRNGDNNWPAKSCDLTPLDYFLWSSVKEKCYANKPETIKYLKANICDVIAKIRIQSNKVLWAQPRQPFEWNNIPFLTGTIVLYNKKKRKILQIFQPFLYHSIFKFKLLNDAAFTTTCRLTTVAPKNYHFRYKNLKKQILFEHKLERLKCK